MKQRSLQRSPGPSLIDKVQSVLRYNGSLFSYVKQKTELISQYTYALSTKHTLSNQLGLNKQTDDSPTYK